MRRVHLYFILCVLLGLVLIAGPVLAAVDDLAAGGGNDKFAPDRVLVKFRAGVDGLTKGRVHAKHGGRVVEEIAVLGVQVVEVPAGKVKEKVKAYKGEKAVVYAEPDFVAEAVGVPNDSYFNLQWGLDNTGQTGGMPDADIDAPEAWDVTTGSTSVPIAILDTGVDQDHEDLAGKIVANVKFSRSRSVDDKFCHGTHVAGIAAAVTNNGVGVAGTGYDCTIMNVKVLDDRGSGYYSWIANGIVWAADHGARVINMSLGGTAPSALLEEAVNYAWSKGVVLVAAAGNSNTADPLYPAYYENCIAVAATDAGDAKAGFSNYGVWVDVAAPGVDIFSTLPNHKTVASRRGLIPLNYGYLSGTSMAAPYVAGTAGLLWATGYGTGNATVRSRIEGTADRVGDIWTTYGIPRLNAYNAVNLQM